ncbi:MULTISPECIES: branched-chain amino acid ABC transporter permease [Streptomyces]|uniref:Branched-chain amino acid ABC transporter permease protein n=1 Tax=Streptomyces griseus subsp. griseus (strain JCM 4626 / CBS 651.72 / NBRC 13350 / KCC S-0626 / ISP 5235) TaxID=455632 RepID=B1VV28_STRGG|nr:branched-chain amino acid ABC transporter permease [Streptomyces griseus]MBW3703671.1 branched-chain amino acid ABC transporter permease [Streptomyces griseus]BAG18012.1 putative branched-chain amino acid ABC transporter permease protein [Streptomyces griseus subsp. griseus NBRC 13350]SED60129.1 amino acid/amide ABC transporter membrane protein 2, HAAT family [Streptomyces griseus]SQA22612.1 Branched-chain amino acid ABC transport permease [Streptomyces griseus]
MSDTTAEAPAATSPVRGGPENLTDRLRGPRTYAVLIGSLLLLVLPFYLDRFWLQAGLFAMAAAIGAIGLNMLTGATGQLSMGHAFFLAVGAYGYSVLAGESGTENGHALTGLGLPTWLAAILAVLLAGAAGGIFSPIAGRLRGAYLGIATLALIFIGQHVLFNAGSLTGGYNGRNVPPLSVFGFTFDDSELVVAAVPFGSSEKLWYAGLLALLLSALFARGVLRGRPGRAMNAIRDHRIAAGVMGVPVARYRAGVFVLSSMYAGLAGVLLALVFQRTVPEYFGMILSLEYLAMIVIGGLGSVAGAVVGAAFVSLLPQVFTHYSDSLPLVSAPGTGGLAPGEASRYLYGAAVVAVVLFLPGGLARLGLARAKKPAAPKNPGEKS